MTPGSAETGRPRVLIVDDEELLLRSVTRLLVRAGYDVVARATVAAATEALRSEPIDVVITDLRIGETSGLEVLRVALALERPPPVIVASGTVSPDDVARAVREGAAVVVKKPMSSADLLAAVASVVTPRA